MTRQQIRSAARNMTQALTNQEYPQVPRKLRRQIARDAAKQAARNSGAVKQV